MPPPKKVQDYGPKDYADLVFSTVWEASTNHGVKMLVYGVSGMGKTRFVATLPRPLIISAESGLLTYRRMIGEGLLDPNTPVIEVKSIEDVRKAYAWCRDHASAHGIQSIGLDSISEITEKCLAAHKAKSNDGRMAYGDMADDIVELVKLFRDLAGFHVVVTAKETNGTDALTGSAKAEPMAPGKTVGPALPYLFDEVFRAYSGVGADGAEFWALATKPTNTIVAKDRSGVLLNPEFPDAAHLISKIMAEPNPVSQPEEQPAQ